jgi:cytochrome c peroxidase
LKAITAISGDSVRGLREKVLLTALVVTASWSLLFLRAAGRNDNQNEDWNMVEFVDSMPQLPAHLGVLPALSSPADNPQTAAKVELGRYLFFDKGLSGNGSLSCASCHDPARGFSDGRRLPVGFDGRTLPRHSPTLLNAAYNTTQFWDGRASTLEEQARVPITSPFEMHLESEAQITRRLGTNAYYLNEFRAVFNGFPDLKNVAMALAAFERTLVTTNSRFDRYVSGDKQALTPEEKKGLVLFLAKARCARCHSGPNFSDNEFHNLGVGGAVDSGRYVVTRNPLDRGAFKTPGLRNVDTHAPYMHDGSLPTLEAVIDYYNRGGNSDANKSKLLTPLGLTAQEKRDLLAFLQALTGDTPFGRAEPVSSTSR